MLRTSNSRVLGTLVKQLIKDDCLVHGIRQYLYYLADPASTQATLNQPTTMKRIKGVERVQNSKVLHIKAMSEYILDGRYRSLRHKPPRQN